MVLSDVSRVISEGRPLGFSPGDWLLGDHFCRQRETPQAEVSRPVGPRAAHDLPVSFLEQGLFCLGYVAEGNRHWQLLLRGVRFSRDLA